MIKFIIFSKDRPAQLDLLLRSIDKYYPDCDYTVIYKASKQEFQDGYDMISNLQKQTDLKTDVLSLMTKECTCFLVDDMQFIAPFKFDDPYFHFMDSDDITCLSLRLYPGITYSYCRDLPITPPPSTVWPWPHYISYWGYPMSLDGHIFKTADIKPLIEGLQFSNPNELEAKLAGNPIRKDFMMCYDKARVVNFPLNIVQATYPNRNMGIDNKLMNDRFLKGDRLKLVELENHNSCHMAIVPEYI